MSDEIVNGVGCDSSILKLCGFWEADNIYVFCLWSGVLGRVGRIYIEILCVTNINIFLFGAWRVNNSFSLLVQLRMR